LPVEGGVSIEAGETPARDDVECHYRLVVRFYFAQAERESAPLHRRRSQFVRCGSDRATAQCAPKVLAMLDLRTARWPARVAAGLAFASAAVSFYWTVGGSLLLDTVGGAIEDLARDGSLGAVALGTTTVLLKALAGVLALALLRPPADAFRRRPTTVSATVSGTGAAASTVTQPRAGARASGSRTAMMPASPGRSRARTYSGQLTAVEAVRSFGASAPAATRSLPLDCFEGGGEVQCAAVLV
jgi:hypothetical protein